MSPARRLAAEFLGSALLLASVVGSGVMGEQLAQGNNALALLANAGAVLAWIVAIALTQEATGTQRVVSR